MITRCGAPPEYRRVQSWNHPGPYHKRYKFIPLTQISPDLQRAVVAAEHARFYQHHGFDWHEIAVSGPRKLEYRGLRKAVPPASAAVGIGTTLPSREFLWEPVLALRNTGPFDSVRLRLTPLRMDNC